MKFLILFVFSRRQNIKQLLGNSGQQIKGKKKIFKADLARRKKYKDMVLHTKIIKTRGLVDPQIVYYHQAHIRTIVYGRRYTRKRHEEVDDC